jgi:hypothetical protein
MLELKLPETKARTVEERLEEIANSKIATHCDVIKDGKNSFNIEKGIFRTYVDGIEAITGHYNDLLVIALYSQTRNMIIHYSIRNKEG